MTRKEDNPNAFELTEKEATERAPSSVYTEKKGEAVEINYEPSYKGWFIFITVMILAALITIPAWWGFWQ